MGGAVGMNEGQLYGLLVGLVVSDEIESYLQNTPVVTSNVHTKYGIEVEP